MMLGKAGIFGRGLGVAAFVDPRAGKTNLIPAGSWSFVAAYEEGPILGPDGVMSGTRFISTGNGSVNSPAASCAPNQVYTFSAYLRTGGDWPIRFGAAATILGYLGYLPDWTLFEGEFSTPLSGLRTLRIGGASFYAGMWVDIAFPMIYEGPKVT